MHVNRTTLAVGGAVAALGLGAVGVDAATTHHAAPAQTFQQRLAKRLGVSPDTLRAATKAAAQDTVKELQQGGTLDADRAAKLQKRIAKTGTAPFARLGRRVARGRVMALRAEAKALGVDRRTLVRELHSGKSPAAVIAAHGKEPADVAKAIEAALAKRSDKLATRVAHRLTGTEPLRRR
jgi:hypothetical protein